MDRIIEVRDHEANVIYSEDKYAKVDEERQDPAPSAAGFRKIDLQTPHDLVFLEANIRRAARARLDSALPPINVESVIENGKTDPATECKESDKCAKSNNSENTFSLSEPFKTLEFKFPMPNHGNRTAALSHGKGSSRRMGGGFKPSSKDIQENDTVRKMVEEKIDDFVQKIFVAVRQNICINGVDIANKPDSVDIAEEYELLDVKLAERLRVLEALKENITDVVADHRRTTPAQIVKRIGSAFTTSYEQSEKQLSALQDTMNDNYDSSELIDLLPRRCQSLITESNQLSLSWKNTCQNIEQLTGQLPETVEYLQRASNVYTYMKNSGLV